MLYHVWAIPPVVIPWCLAFLILFEIALAVWLCCGRMLHVAFPICCAFLVVLTISPVRQLASGSPLACGCGLALSLFPPPVHQVMSIATNIALVCVIWLCRPDRGETVIERSAKCRVVP